MRLLQAYGFSNGRDRNKFLTDFKNFHNKDNADKQDIEQFVNEGQLQQITDYLLQVQKSH